MALTEGEQNLVHDCKDHKGQRIGRVRNARKKSGLRDIAAMVWRMLFAQPAAFAELRAVSEAGLVAFDGVRSTNVPWSRVQRITAAMGQQQYDMTRILTIDDAAGRSIFLPEVEELWAPFVAAMPCYLPGALPEADWVPRLSADPELVICIYAQSC